MAVSETQDSVDHRGPDSASALALFPSEADWVRTRVLDARAIETCDFDLESFARYRCIRILTYSASVAMLHTVLERFAESRVECVLGYSRVVNNVASIILITYRVPWKGTVPQRVRIPPGKLSLQPVAIGADDGGNDIVRSTSV